MLFDGIPQHGAVLGRRHAPATVVLFVDPQCPACAAYAGQVLPGLVARYVRTGKVRMKLRILAFLGPDSSTAADMAYAAARQHRMWQYTQSFFAHQREENTGYVTRAFLRTVGDSVPGLRVPRALADRHEESVHRHVAAARHAARRYGIDSVPAIVVRARGRTPRRLSDPSRASAAIERLLHRQMKARSTGLVAG